MFDGGPGPCEGTRWSGRGWKRRQGGLGEGGELGLGQAGLLDEVLGICRQVTHRRETFLGKQLEIQY